MPYDEKRDAFIIDNDSKCSRQFFYSFMRRTLIRRKRHKILERSNDGIIGQCGNGLGKYVT